MEAPSVGVRILAVLLVGSMVGLLWGSIQATPMDGQALLRGGFAVAGIVAGVGLWMQRRWGAVLFAAYSIGAFTMWTSSLGVRDMVDVLFVLSMAIIYAAVIWVAWNGTYSRRELALEE
ncbi:MAG: hypothetical protein EA352_01985 [Gemmatimonadales bacterium]|nr:MAG: hypothetical protein EA352_01985 [Gemmatimonadales bacterium]